MPGRRLSRYHRRLNLRAALIRATIGELDTGFSRHESGDLHLAGVIIRDCQNADDADMILEKVWRHHVERGGGTEKFTKDGVRKIQNSEIDAFLDATVRYINNWRS
ncbi:hypothetical protein M758_9G108600 [Ceratodon purpureus]|nr:hypothetical protein M758_9G108600 [Ceratodon purpureus]